MQKYFKKLTMSFPKIPFLTIKKKKRCASLVEKVASPATIKLQEHVKEIRKKKTNTKTWQKYKATIQTQSNCVIPHTIQPKSLSKTI